jgi:hypothetical protein
MPGLFIYASSVCISDHDKRKQCRKYLFSKRKILKTYLCFQENIDSSPSLFRQSFLTDGVCGVTMDDALNAFTLKVQTNRTTLASWGETPFLAHARRQGKNNALHT